MKNTLIVLSLILTSYTSFAIEPGRYQCVNIDEEIAKEGSFDIIITDEKIVFPEHTIEKEQYRIQSPTQDFINVTLTSEEILDGLEYFKYKLFRNDSETLLFESREKYKDENEYVLKLIMTKDSNEQFKIVDSATSNGIVVKYESVCQREAQKSI